MRKLGNSSSPQIDLYARAPAQPPSILPLAVEHGHFSPPAALVDYASPVHCQDSSLLISLVVFDFHDMVTCLSVILSPSYRFYTKTKI
jgi:hypothetical protein